MNREIEFLKDYIMHGKTLQQIGIEYGLTRERVRQVLSKYPEYFEYRKQKLSLTNTIVSVVCKNCGKTFKKLIWKSTDFCSIKCLGEWRVKENAKVRDALTEKRCSQCKKILPISMFYKEYVDYRRYSSHCKKCHAVVTQRWKDKNPERVAEINKRSGRKHYKLYRTEILKKQNANNYIRYHTDPVYREKVLERGRRYWREHYSRS